MRKILSVLICLMLLCSLAVSASAEGLAVTFTDDSLPEIGGKLTVDKYAMLDSGNITAEMYNALLEGYVLYSWYKDGKLTQEGIGADAISYKVTDSDAGCTLYVAVSFYGDSSFQESIKCGEAVSGKLTVTGPAPRITTKNLPAATVGKDYYVRLECSDPDAVFSEVMGSQLTEFGMCLTQHGEIEGTPAKAGNCHVNILAVSEGGGENSVSFDITVSAAPVQDETTEPSAAQESTAPSAAQETDPEETKAPVPAPEVPEDTKAFPWWGYLLIILGGITTGIGIAFIFIKLKKKL